MDGGGGCHISEASLLSWFVPCFVNFGSIRCTKPCRWFTHPVSRPRIFLIYISFLFTFSLTDIVMEIETKQFLPGRPISKELFVWNLQYVADFMNMVSSAYDPFKVMS
jgi:hypothetical protein